jgi:hypothetical protein
MEKLYCETCEAPLPTRNGNGRSRRYCSTACKKAAYRQRKAQRPGLCEHCGEVMGGKGRFCSDRCYYCGHGGIVPFDRLDLAAFDEGLIPLIPRGQIHAHDLNRPAWHAWVYCGRRSGR